ncbi:MAG: serine--tRNA ligase [Alphaproteobacteria bacterium]|nr:serine--tRNA ligase [Alphaproteobacteria bacterium]
MHDIKAIREDFNAFKRAIGRRPLSEEQKAQVASLLEIDDAWRAATAAKQQAEAARNAASKQIGAAKAAKDDARAAALMEEVAGYKATIESAGADEATFARQRDDILASLPNIPAADVPDGADEDANIENKRWNGELGVDPPSVYFVDSSPARGGAEAASSSPVHGGGGREAAGGGNEKVFVNPKDHVTLGEAWGLMDFEGAARMSGARFVALKGSLARMERALAAFMLDIHTQEKGYTEVAPPLLVKDKSAFGTGQLPKFKGDLFSTLHPELAQAVMNVEEQFKDVVFLAGQRAGPGKVHSLSDAVSDVPKFSEVTEALQTFLELVEKERFWLTPTAEVSLTNLVREQILSEDQFPIRMTADTPCFRSEAGSAGRDTRGMIRMHQFRKVELVSITLPEHAEAEHERMTACAEDILQRLGLPYRRMLLCAGDMGFSARKTYDLEVWLPSQNKYREISSCSNCGDFQARRMNARVRRADKKIEFVHTLNGSGLAVGRTLVAVLENYQNPDGSVTIPGVLRPYMGGLERIG